MNEKTNQNNAKRVYEKPVLSSFKLMADEVLITGCKTDSGTATNGFDSGQPCAALSCQTPGS